MQLLFSAAEGKALRKTLENKKIPNICSQLDGRMFLLKKLSVVEAIRDVPTEVSKAIKRINDIRNALAHSLFPENRRRYMNDKKVNYSGAFLFSLEGIEKFRDDCAIAEIWLHKAAFRKLW